MLGERIKENDQVLYPLPAVSDSPGKSNAMNILNITLPYCLFNVQDKLAMKLLTELTCPKPYFRGQKDT